MQYALIAALVAAVSAAPTDFSLPNGFPYYDAASIAGIYKQAGGTLPNTALPMSLEADAITDLKVIAVNEIFEASYFTSLLYNVTIDMPGYTDFGGATKEYVVEVLQAIRAQEELHAIGANAILVSAGSNIIDPCAYHYPVSDYKSAIALAATFTELVLGTLQQVNMMFALDGGAAASGLVPLISSIIGQEGEQTGYFRSVGQQVPSSAPFLTAGAGVFAFNAVAQNFIVPDSCGADVAAIGIPSLATLTTATMPGPMNSTVTYLTSAMDVEESNYVTYISGQNAPVVVPISNIAASGDMMTFEAAFPYDIGFARGLTIAALTKSAGPYASAGAVAMDSIAGPGLITVD